MVAQKLKPLDGKIFLISLKDHIKEIFEIAEFLSIFQVFDRKVDTENNFLQTYDITR